MIRRKLRSQLGIRFTVMASLAFVVSVSLFLFLYGGMTHWLMDSSCFDFYWERAEVRAVSDFQEYVSENSLSVDEVIRDVEWEQTYDSAYLYFSGNPDEYLSDSSTERGIPLECSDGIIYTYAFPSTSHYENIGLIISLGIAALFFLLILTPYIYRIIRRITHLSREMEIIAGGELNYSIDSKGEDELAELGRSIDGMRLSVIEQMARENEAVAANSRLITSLSHDLRTPLTKLTGYLEILRYRRYRDAEDGEKYILRAIEQAEQMKSLSDEMFRGSLVSADSPRETGTGSVSGATLLSQILSELCFDLQSEGFTAEPPSIEGEFSLSIPIVSLHRIFDNLFSNAKKYADPSKPIVVSVDRKDEEIGITVSNGIGRKSSAESNGIGLPTVKRLVEENGGRLRYGEKGDRFTVTLCLPTAERSHTLKRLTASKKAKEK